MNLTLTDVLRSVNKVIGALVGGGVIALLVGLHVIPASVGNTVLTVLGVAATALGTFLAPSNKPINTDPGVPDNELGGLDHLAEGALDRVNDLTDGALTKLVKQSGDDGYDERPSPHPHD